MSNTIWKYKVLPKRVFHPFIFFILNLSSGTIFDEFWTSDDDDDDDDDNDDDDGNVRQ